MWKKIKAWFGYVDEREEVARPNLQNGRPINYTPGRPGPRPNRNSTPFKDRHRPARYTGQPNQQHNTWVHDPTPYTSYSSSSDCGSSSGYSSSSSDSGSSSSSSDSGSSGS